MGIVGKSCPGCAYCVHSNKNLMKCLEDELYRILNCPYYDKVYGCLDCYIEKCPYYEVETEEIQ